MTLDPLQLFALVGAMLALAIVPDASALAVVARALAAGAGQALMVVAGILLADFLFIGLALYSLSAIAATAGWLFDLVKLLAAAYLFWMAWCLWRMPSDEQPLAGVRQSSWLTSFGSGLAITLGDPKAIFFYVSFLPAYVDPGAITALDTGLVMLSAALAVGGVKTAYALLADRARRLLRHPAARRRINRFAALVMLLTALLLLPGW